MESSSVEKKGTALLLEAVLQSWAAWAFLWIYVGLNVIWSSGVTEHQMYWLGGLALGAILLAMNGLARTELWWTSRSPKWFREHPLARLLHSVHNEGELAGIFVSSVVLVFQLGRGLHVHLALVEAFTLFGIMSAANLAVHQMMPIMAAVEKAFGVWGAICVGSFLSSLTGEPAAAIFLSEYFKSRIPEKDRKRFATGLGATIGSGGGLMPFSAPPILIIWAILQSVFGWTLPDLWMFVGGGCLLHVGITAWRMRHMVGKIQPMSKPKQKAASWQVFWPLYVLTTVVGLNVSYEYHHLTALTWITDGAVGIWALVRAIRDPSITETEGHEQEGHGRHWQPLTLGLLLMGLEIVGVEAEKLLLFLTSFIPETLPVFVIAMMLWYATAFTSHFADNALASRIFITVAAALTTSLGGHGDLLALSVVLGALFGGFLLIPANLPNFAIAAEFRMNAGDWAGTAYRWYPTCIAHVVWIGAMYYLLIP
ncbi:MAG: hypothetical protein O2904_00940 [bacterium]|nr:hypothetical protein [bacterium]